MKTSLIALTSITYAIKAQKLLNSHGYFCGIERTPKEFSRRTGCGYSIRIKDDVNTICQILKQSGINYLGIIEG